MPTKPQLQSFANTLSDEFLYCRRYGHNWHPRTAIKRKGWYEATVFCQRCTSERLEVISLRGEVVRSSMHYPKGYLAHNIGRIVGESKNYLRIEALGRHLGSVTPTPE